MAVGSLGILKAESRIAIRRPLIIVGFDFATTTIQVAAAVDQGRRARLDRVRLRTPRQARPIQSDQQAPRFEGKTPRKCLAHQLLYKWWRTICKWEVFHVRHESTPTPSDRLGDASLGCHLVLGDRPHAAAVGLKWSIKTGRPIDVDR